MQQANQSGPCTTWCGAQIEHSTPTHTPLALSIDAAAATTIVPTNPPPLSDFQGCLLLIHQPTPPQRRGQAPGSAAAVCVPWRGHCAEGRAEQAGWQEDGGAAEALP
jgi:hypothetical protein